MGAPSPDTPSAAKVSESRLDSWKEIAAYLGRDVTTVQRWEKREGMPVHRHLHDKRGSVYAVPAELDSWRESRKLRLEQERPEIAPDSTLPPPPATARRAPVRLHLWLALAGLAALAILAIAFFMARGHADRAAAPKIRSLAVLPLKNLSGDSNQQYLADGMTEALTDRLTQIRDLRVISHTSVMQFKNSQTSAPEIAKELGVDALVEGSVTREGNHIRVTAQLIRAATDDHFWSESYDRELKDALSLESDLAQNIAGKVEATLTGRERERLAAARPISPEAYESYLQGLYQLERTDTKADVDKGLRYFQDAIARDPTFAPAYVGLAESYALLGSNFVGEPPNSVIQKEEAAARKALELDPDLPDAHDLLAYVAEQRWQWAEAQAEFNRALASNPNDASAYAGLAWWFIYQGRTEEGLAAARRARQLDPPVIEGPDFGWMLSEARHFDEAEHEIRSALAVRPDDAPALWDLGTVLMYKQQPAQAVPVLEKAVSLSHGSPGVIGTLIRAYAQAGRRSDALRLLAELNARRKKGFVPAWPFVNAYMGLGDKDQAFAWLQQACTEHSNIIRLLKVDPFFDPLRSDPRFAALLRRVALS